MDHRRDMDRGFLMPLPNQASRGQRGIFERPTQAHDAAARRTGRGRLFHRFRSAGLMLAACGFLAGCVDSFVSAQVPQETSAAPPNMTRRAGVSPSSVTVAVASLSGGPDAVRARFATAFDEAAKAQAIIMATPAAADYLVRGYLNAVPEPNGTAVTYVLDIFDSKKHRTQRVEDQILLKATAPDPWLVVDDSALTAVAAKSAAALAAVLTNTPEAIMAAAKVQPGTAQPAVAADAGGDGRSIVAATPPVGPPEAAAPAPDLGRVALH
jgi:hypothetical protein